MTNVFAGLLTGNNVPASPTVASTGSNAFAGLLTGKTTAPIVQPTSVVNPSPNINPTGNTGIPATALTGTLGGGYGAATDIDPTSGKPLLTYENPIAMSSQLLSDRTAPTFDPTVPQPVSPSTLQDPRMALSVSEGIRGALGASTYQQLDHIVPLELGGSNNKSNLALENDIAGEKNTTAGSQPTAPIEDNLASQVHSGQISLVDAWKSIAQTKGITLPEQGGVVPQVNQTQTEKQQPSSQTFFQKVDNVIKTALSPQGQNAVFNELGGQALVHPVQTIKNIVAKTSSDLTNVTNNLLTSAAQFKSDVLTPSTNRDVPTKVASTLNLLVSMAQFTLAPVGEAYSIATQLPVIKPAADAVGVLFNDSGKVASFTADKLLSGAVSTGAIKQSTADELKSAVDSVSSLAGQIILGGYVYGHIEDAMSAKAPVDEEAIVQDAQTKAAEINKEPIPQTVEPTNAFKGLLTGEKPEPSATPVKPSENEGAPKTTLDEFAKENPTTVKEVPVPKTRVSNQLKEIEGTGDVKVRGAAKSLESAAIKAGLVDSYGDLPEYKTMDFGAVADKVKDFISEDKDKAKSVAMGEANPPKGVPASFVWTELARQATLEGDGELAAELSKSKVITQGTEAGRFIGGFKGLDEENPVQAIKDLQDARDKALQKKSVSESTKFDDAVKKAKSDRLTGKVKVNWDSFIDSIQC